MLVLAGGVYLTENWDIDNFVYKTAPYMSVVICKIYTGGILQDQYCSVKEISRPILGGSL